MELETKSSLSESNKEIDYEIEYSKIIKIFAIGHETLTDIQDRLIEFFQECLIYLQFPKDKIPFHLYEIYIKMVETYKNDLRFLNKSLILFNNEADLITQGRQNKIIEDEFLFINSFENKKIKYRDCYNRYVEILKKYMFFLNSIFLKLSEQTQLFKIMFNNSDIKLDYLDNIFELKKLINSSLEKIEVLISNIKI